MKKSYNDHIEQLMRTATPEQRQHMDGLKRTSRQLFDLRQRGGGSNRAPSRSRRSRQTTGQHSPPAAGRALGDPRTSAAAFVASQGDTAQREYMVSYLWFHTDFLRLPKRQKEALM